MISELPHSLDDEPGDPTKWTLDNILAERSRAQSLDAVAVLPSSTARSGLSNSEMSSRSKPSHNTTSQPLDYRASRLHSDAMAHVPQTNPLQVMPHNAGYQVYEKLAPTISLMSDQSVSCHTIGSTNTDDSGYRSLGLGPGSDFPLPAYYVQSNIPSNFGTFGNSAPPYTVPESVASCALCGRVAKNKSDAAKHLKQHTRPHLCEEIGCSRKEGFATLHDLERHRKSVHRLFPRVGDCRGYVCAACSDNGQDAAAANKLWPRLDSFKSHVRRKHSDWDETALIQR